MMQMVSNESTTLIVRQLNPGVEREVLFNEFKKFKPVLILQNRVKHYATLHFSTSEDAEDAKRSLNHKLILGSEILVANYRNQDELKEKKKFNLFIKNVPEELDTKTLECYLTKFGKIIALLLKKKEQNKNIGYGYVQFEDKKSYDDIIEAQQNSDNNELIVDNTAFTFKVEPFGVDKQKIKSDNIYIRGFYENEVEESDQPAKLAKIESILDKIKTDVSIKCNFNYYVHFDENKKNYWVSIDCLYTNVSDDNEKDVYIILKKAIAESFKYENGDIPYINYQTSEISEKNIFIQGLTNDINEEKLAAWLKEKLAIEVDLHDIKIRASNPPKQASPETPQQTPAAGANLVSYQCYIYFNLKEHGQKLMEFCANPKNQQAVYEIFQDRRKITLNLSKSDMVLITQGNKKAKEYFKNASNFADNKQLNVTVHNPQQQQQQQ